MPDCSNDAIVEVLRDMADNVSAGTTALGDKIRAIDFSSGLSQAGEVLGDLGTAALQSAASQIIEDAGAFGYAAGLGSVGSMLATILSGGQLAYLGLAGFLFTLLRYDLESRVIVASNFLDDLNSLSVLIGLLQNLSKKRNGEDDLVLQRAYEEIYEANKLLGDINKQLKALEYYSNESVPTIKGRLDQAQELMDTPIIDSLITIAENASFAPQSWEIAHNVIRNPQSVYDDMYKDLTEEGSETRNADYQVYTASTSASRSQQLDTFMTGIMEYLDYSGTAAMIDFKVKELAMNIITYLPLSPLAKVALLANFAPKISAAPASSSALLTVDFTDVSYRGLIDSNNNSSRSLDNLNKSIKTRITWLSKFPLSFGDMTLVNNLTAKGIDEVAKELDELTKDIEQFVPYPVPSPDQSGPEKLFHPRSSTAKSFKMVAWKSRIESVKRLLNTVDSTVGQQAESIGNSHNNLDAIMAVLETYVNEDTGFYNDDNNFTPDGEGSVEHLTKLVGMLFDNLTDSDGLVSIQNQISESKLSLHLAIAADRKLIQVINTFTGSILSGPGMQTQMHFLDSVLSNSELTSSNNTLKYLVDEIKIGNIQLVTNLALGALQEAGTLGEEGLNAIQNMPSLGEVGDAFAVAMGSIGSALGNIGECIGQLGRPRVVNDLQKDAESALAQSLIDGEKQDSAIGAANSAQAVLQDKLDKLNGVEIPAEDLPVTIDGVGELSGSTESAYIDLGITTSNGMIK